MVLDLILPRMVGERPPTSRNKLWYLKVLLSRSWIELFLSSHLQEIGRGTAYKELFEKMAEDIGYLRRDYEEI